MRDRLGIDAIITVLHQNKFRWYEHGLQKKENDWVKMHGLQSEGCNNEVGQKNLDRGCGNRLLDWITKPGGCYGPQCRELINAELTSSLHARVNKSSLTGFTLSR